MADKHKKARVVESVRPDQIPFDDIFSANEPVILRGLVADWPMVRAGKESPRNGMEFLEANYSGKPVTVYIGDPEINARFGYNDTCTGFNYKAEKMSLNNVFAEIRNGFDKRQHPFYYINSLLLKDGFPDIVEENGLVFNHPEFAQSAQIAKIWIGTESRAPAHYDIPKNMACCVIGRRRFTLFPPDQVHNLYPGPLNPTPGGQVITMVDLKNPDFDRHPRFKQALDSSVVADLEPGDVLYYPSMWWHEVEARDSFNVMVNYWWIGSAAYMGNPLDALMHAMLSLRDRPENEKKAWRELFDYYIFGSAENVTAHLPEECLGSLANMDELTARRLRAQLQHNLNR